MNDSIDLWMSITTAFYSTRYICIYIYLHHLHDVDNQRIGDKTL
jgi:hypothetical protein